MPEFLLKLDIKNKESLGAVRCMEGLQAAEEGNCIWIRGINALLEMDKELLRLPATNTFIIDEENNLFLPGGLTPVAILKPLEWTSLTGFITVEAPTAALPGKTNDKVKLKIIPSAIVRKGAAILTTLDVWKQYAETASETRLFATRFAVSEKNKVLIMGDPLPSLPGIEYWQTGNVLLPAGYDFEFSIMEEFVNKKLNENKSSVILFDKDGSWQKIDKSFFVISKRSAIRLTALND